MGAGDRSEGSAGGRRDGGRAGEAPVGPTAAAGSAKRGRRSSGALSTETAVATLQNCGNGRRHCGMAEAAAVILQEGRTAAAALQDSGGLGASLLLYSDWGELVAARSSGALAAKTAAAALQDGENDGGGSARRRRRRRRFCKAAETAAATLQEAATWARLLFPYPLSFKGYPRSGFPLPLSRDHGKVTSTYHYSSFQKHSLSILLPPFLI